MKLLTKAIESRLPALYSSERIPLNDKVLAVKFFDPTGGWTWYGVEYNPKTRVFFGYVVGFEPEWGQFSLDELESVKGKLGLGIERDMYWEPITFAEAQEKGIV